MAQPEPLLDLLSKSPSVPPKPSVLPNIEAEIERISTGGPLITTQRDDDFYLWLNSQRDSKTCGIVLSAHRSGISESSKHYRLKHVKYRGAVLLLPVSVVYIQVPSGCTPAQLFVELLQALHRNLKFGRIGDLRNRTRATIREYGVKLLVVDDAHYLKLKALRELVQIHELLKIPVILSGTGELYDQLKSEWKQVHNSFLSFYPFPAMTIDQTGSVVEKWLEKFLGWEGEESALFYDDVMKKLYEKTGGLTGPLNDTLQRIAIQVLNKRLRRLEELAKDETLDEYAIQALKNEPYRLDEQAIHEVLDGQMSAATN